MTTVNPQQIQAYQNQIDTYNRMITIIDEYRSILIKVEDDILDGKSTYTKGVSDYVFDWEGDTKGAFLEINTDIVLSSQKVRNRLEDLDRQLYVEKYKLNELVTQLTKEISNLKSKAGS